MLRNQEAVTRLLAIVIGAILFSAAMNMLLLPGEIVLGGMTGIATVLKLFFGLPIGGSILFLNLPLLLLGARRFGHRFAVRTMVGVAVTSAAADLLPVEAAATSPILASVIGGAMVGVSAGLLLASGFSTGGTDLLALLFCELFPGLTLGTMIALADGVIILGAALLTRQGEGVAYSLLCALSAGVCTDAVLRHFGSIIHR